MLVTGFHARGRPSVDLGIARDGVRLEASVACGGYARPYERIVVMQRVVTRWIP